MFVASMCFLNNSVPQNAIGRANGLGQAIASGLRGLGPLLGGVIWSWSMTLDSTQKDDKKAIIMPNGT